MQLGFEEIPDWKTFEDLVASYFRYIKNDTDNNLIDVEVKPSGESADGGVDILLTFELSDSIKRLKRKWVVQCKFVEGSVGKSIISDTNIPTLVHEYNAVGYLLIVKKDVTKLLVDSFKNLNENCKFGYRYEIWQGAEFIEKIRIAPEQLIQQYFHKVYQSK